MANIEAAGSISRSLAALRFHRRWPQCWCPRRQWPDSLDVGSAEGRRLLGSRGPWGQCLPATKKWVGPRTHMILSNLSCLFKPTNFGRRYFWAMVHLCLSPFRAVSFCRCWPCIAIINPKLCGCNMVKHTDVSLPKVEANCWVDSSLIAFEIGLQRGQGGLEGLGLLRFAVAWWIGNEWVLWYVPDPKSSIHVVGSNPILSCKRLVGTCTPIKWFASEVWRSLKIESISQISSKTLKETRLLWKPLCEIYFSGK